jgi:hypothetical protein
VIKTVFTVVNESIDSRVSTEWPAHITNDVVRTLAQLRRVSFLTMWEILFGDEVLQFCNAVRTMQVGTLAKDKPKLFVVDSNVLPTDAQLLGCEKVVFEHTALNPYIFITETLNENDSTNNAGKSS